MYFFIIKKQKMGISSKRQAVCISGKGQQDNSATMGQPLLTCFLSQLFLGKLKGNLMPQTSQRKRCVHVTEARQRPGESSTLPVRLTSCIFQRPVTRITSQLGSKVRCSQWENLEKPRKSLETGDHRDSRPTAMKEKSFGFHRYLKNNCTE